MFISEGVVYVCVHKIQNRVPALKKLAAAYNDSVKITKQDFIKYPETDLQDWTVACKYWLLLLLFSLL